MLHVRCKAEVLRWFSSAAAVPLFFSVVSFCEQPKQSTCKPGSQHTTLTSQDAGEVQVQRPAVLSPRVVGQGRFEPPPGQILFIAGQTKRGLENFAANFPAPGGISFYTSVKNLWGTGLSDQTSPETRDFLIRLVGEQDLDYLVRKFPNSALHVGLALDGGILAKLASGGRLKVDGVEVDPRANARELIDLLEKLGRPVFLRIGYEAEGPWNGYDPQAYRLAFKYITNYIQQTYREKGDDHIAVVWHIAGYIAPHEPTNHDGFVTYQCRPFDDWYPAGGEGVDWVAFSFFTQPYDEVGMGRNPGSTMRSVLTYLRTKNKPILIAESAPRTYDFNYDSRRKENQPGRGYFKKSFQTAVPNFVDNLTAKQMWDGFSDGGTSYPGWFATYFKMIEENRDAIRAVHYINDEWQRYTLWQCKSGEDACRSGYWGDTRLEIIPQIQRMWLERAGRDRFLEGSPTLFGQLNGWKINDPLRH
jgi:hypothetical protein